MNGAYECWGKGDIKARVCPSFTPGRAPRVHVEGGGKEMGVQPGPGQGCEELKERPWLIWAQPPSLPSAHRGLQSLAGAQIRAGEIWLSRIPVNHWGLGECGHVDKQMALCRRVSTHCGPTSLSGRRPPCAIWLQPNQPLAGPGGAGERPGRGQRGGEARRHEEAGPALPRSLVRARRVRLPAACGCWKFASRRWGPRPRGPGRAPRNATW